MRRADIWTVFALTVCGVCVLLLCKIQLLFQFPLLLGILNQCDSLIFRHFLFSPSLLPPSSRLMLPLTFFPSFPPLTLPLLFPPLPVGRSLVVCVSLHRSASPLSLPFFLFSFSQSPSLSPTCLLFVLLHAGSLLPPSLSSSF